MAPTSFDELLVSAGDLVPSHVAPARDEETLFARRLAERGDLYRPELPATSVERSRSVRGVLLGVGVVLVFVGWYVVGGSLHRTPPASAESVASPSASAGTDTPGGPEPTQTSQTQPALPSSRARANITPPAEEIGKQPGVTSASAQGRLLVRSTPSGARVFVDDQEYGLTPAIIRGLALRTHGVRVIRDGYISEERRVQFASTSAALSITFELDQPPANASARDLTSPLAITGTSGGTLSVDSHPVGASVYVDELLVGKTPVLISQIGVGTHVVRLELDAHRRWFSTVRVTFGGWSRVTASLEQEN